MEEMRFKKLHKDAALPTRGSKEAAGLDLSTIEDFSLEPGEKKLVGTGLCFELPKGYYGRIAPRSGLAHKYGIDVLAGVVDSDYRGEIKVILINLSKENVSFQKGDRIAQLIIEKIALPKAVFIEDLDDSDRGEGGFGSTG